MKNPSLNSNRTQIKQMKERASYDLTAIYSALDESPIATIAFHDGQNTHALPMLVWRDGGHIYLHGSNGSRLIKTLQKGIQVCVSVTHIQGFVLARSAFKHSLNYTSVCIYGTFETVPEYEKNQRMQAFFDHWLPERWSQVRQPDQNELAATTFLRCPLTEAVLKTRQGPPNDFEDDLNHPVWAGVLPVKWVWLEPEPVEEQASSLKPPCYLSLS